jgi:hypothetical protein
MERTSATCEKCSKARFLRRAVFNLPQVLIIQLKRYINLNKNNVKVDIDFQLNSNLLGNKLNIDYALSGIVCHGGESVHCGHYIAYCKDKDLNWRKYNDTLQDCEFVDFSGKLNFDYNFCVSNSYLLFYTLNDLKSANYVHSVEQKFSRMIIDKFQETISDKSSTSNNMLIEIDNENFSLDDEADDDIDNQNVDDGMEIDDDEFAKIIETTQHDSDDDEYSDQIDDAADNFVINNIKMFFTFKKDDESTSGFLTIHR